jgi:hypothetical protein
MTAAYLTEPEIIRELRLPEKVGRAKLAEWKLSPTFPKPEPGMSGRRYFPLIEAWLNRHHRINAINDMPAPVADGRESIDDWKERRKARKATGPRNAGACLPPPPQPRPLAPNLVATIGPGGKRLSQDHLSPVAPVGGESTSA